MYNFYEIFVQPLRCAHKIVMVMKITALLIMTVILHVSASSLAQKVTLSENNTPLVDVFNTIRNQTGYDFLFSSSIIQHARPVTIRVKNTELEAALMQIFDGQALSFTIEDHAVVVVAKTVNSNKAITIKGIVLDSKGQPVIGVTIKSDKGQSTATNSVGEYSIQTDADATLTFSSVGYVSKTVKIEGRQKIDVTLEESNNAMNEVVVTALGIKRQEKALGYATQKVSGESLTTVKGVDVGTSLTGMVSGLVVKNSTEFDARPTIQLRGESPLLVIDGVAYGNMTLRDVPTDDIESVDVLKGPTAAALYGSRGSAGALMITTKSGKRKGLAIDVNTDNMVTTGYLAMPKAQTSYGHGIDGKISNDYVWGPKLDIGTIASQWDPISKQMKNMPLVSSSNNLGNFMQTGIVSNNNISVTQTGENGFFKTGLNYIYNKGEWPNATLKVINFTTSGQLKIGDKFDLQTHTGYTRQTSPQIWGSGYNNQGYLYQLIMWTGPDYDIRQYKDYWVTPNQQQNWLYTTWYDNPWLIANEKLESIDQNKLNASLIATYKFSKDLKLMFRTGYDYYKNELIVRNPPNLNSTRGASSGTFSWSWNAAGMFGEDETWGLSTNNDLILTYNKKIGKFGVDLLAGGSLYYYIDQELGAITANGLSVPGFYSLANAAPSTAVGVNSITNNYSTSKSQINSAYGKATLSYGSGVFIDITGRNDWSSTQQASQRSYFYPSVAGSVLLSEFFKTPDWIDMWKIRGSWTIVKNPAGVYSNNRTYSTGTSFGLITSSYPSNLLGTNILPSTARTWEIGTAGYLFKKRLHLDVAYFDKYYYNRQTSATISNGSGFTSSLVNTKETYARRGLEITADGTILKNSSFSWNSMVNFSFDHRYYVNLDPVYTADDLFHKVGERLDDYTVNNWLRDPNGNIINSGGLPQTSNYASKIGYGDPDFSFGFVNTLNYKNFSLSMNWDGRVGGLMYDYVWDKMFDSGSNPETVNQYRYDQVVKGLNDYLAPGVKVVSGTVTYDKYGHITSDTRQYAPNDVLVGYQQYARKLYGNGDHGIMNETFVKLRQVSIGYNFPQKMLMGSGIKTASVSLTGQNLLLLTGFKFSDPDIDTENLNAPSQRIIGLDIKLGL